MTSLVFLLLATGMLAGRPDFLLRPTLTGHGLAWMILLLLGAGMGGVFGVVYWALPRVFRVPLYSEKFALLHYGFHYVGVLLVLASIVWKGFGRGEMGMTFLACGALVMGINLIGTFRKPALPDVASAYLVSSALWLLIVGLLGVPFSERAPIEVLEGTQWSAGWLLLTVTGVLLNLGMGVALRLTPAVLRVKARNTSVAWYGFAFSNAGLAWMFPAATFGQKSFLLVCLGVYGVGVLLFLGRYFMDVQLREEEGLGWDSRIVFTSVWLIPVAVGVLGWAVWSRMWQEKPAEVATAGGVGVVEEVAKGGLPLEYFSADGAVFLISVLAVAVPMAVGLGFGLLRLEGREAGG
ncbi:MAG: hypothetical protein NZL93_06960, partial [Chthoniobacterales bacterium]|nr:hypothetical protein [Chthoniobacterales bacterium]